MNAASYLSSGNGEEEAYDVPFLKYSIQARLFVINAAEQNRTQKKRNLQFFIYISQGGSGGNLQVAHLIYGVAVEKRRRVNLNFHGRPLVSIDQQLERCAVVIHPGITTK